MTVPDDTQPSPPPVAEAVRFISLPLGASGSRAVVVTWSDGSSSKALRWWREEVLFTEGDFIGKTQAEITQLKHRRDRDYLQS